MLLDRESDWKSLIVQSQIWSQRTICQNNRMFNTAIFPAIIGALALSGCELSFDPLVYPECSPFAEHVSFISTLTCSERLILAEYSVTNPIPDLGTQTKLSPILARQQPGSQLPAACQSQCASTATINDACAASGRERCISLLCQPTPYSEFTNCLQCAVNNIPSATAADVSAINSFLSQVSRVCSASGQSVNNSSASAKWVPLILDIEIACWLNISGSASGSSILSVSTDDSMTSTGILSQIFHDLAENAVRF